GRCRGRLAPEGVERGERVRHLRSPLWSVRLAAQFDALGPVMRVPDLLPIPRLELAASEQPFVTYALVGVPVRDRLIEPVLGSEHMVMRSAVDDTVCMVVVVEVDDVVGDEVHGAVELPEDVVVERLHSLP